MGLLSRKPKLYDDVPEYRFPWVFYIVIFIFTGVVFSVWSSEISDNYKTGWIVAIFICGFFVLRRFLAKNRIQSDINLFLTNNGFKLPTEYYEYLLKLPVVQKYKKLDFSNINYFEYATRHYSAYIDSVFVKNAMNEANNLSIFNEEQLYEMLPQFKNHIFHPKDGKHYKTICNLKVIQEMLNEGLIIPFAGGGLYKNTQFKEEELDVFDMETLIL